MGNCYSIDHIVEDHIHIKITCNIEETQQNHFFYSFTLCRHDNLMLLCSHSPNDVTPELQRNVYITAVRGAVLRPNGNLSFG